MWTYSFGLCLEIKRLRHKILKGSQEVFVSCEPFLFTLNICWNFSSQIHQLISSIRFRFHPSNCMIILCNVVPWRNVSTLGASSDSLNHQKEIELGFIWIWNEAQVNFNRATRKLCLSLKPVWTEAYFNGNWSLLQWQTKPISKADEAYLVYCISKIVRDKTKIVRDAWGINPPFGVSVTHVVSCLSITYPVSSWKSWWVIDDLAKIYSPSAPFLSLFCFNTIWITVQRYGFY